MGLTDPVIAFTLDWRAAVAGSQQDKEDEAKAKRGR